MSADCGIIFFRVIRKRKRVSKMNNERFLVFDIDDTLYSQMEPLLTACEFSLGRKLPDPELFYRIFGKRSAEMGH